MFTSAHAVRNSFVNALSLGWQWESALDALFAPPGPRRPRALMDSTGFHSVIRAADAVSHWPLAIGLLKETWRDGWKDPDMEQRERDRESERKENID